MAAYAALVSLINNIEQIKNHPRVSTFFDNKQLESLLERVDSLLDFVESYNSYGGSKDEVEDLERQITSAAHFAEDVIESHIVAQILPQVMIQFQSPVADQVVGGSNIQSVMFDLEKTIQDMDSVRKMVVMMVDVEIGCKVESSMPSAVASSRQLSTVGKSNMIGFDDYLTRILDQLTGDQSDRRIIPIVGMGGIGKTTLARNAYDSLLVVHHFDVRAWVTVSQTFIVRGILLETLSCLGQSKHEMDKKGEHELGELMHKTLFGRRYLIVLDDMWSTEAWDRIKFYFPNNCNRSRIVVTTRISDVANHFGSIGLELSFLDKVHSWKLFCEKVFPHEFCPAELEESGKEIVKKCRGLPLAIVVIGGLLGNSSRTKDHWENVAKDISSTLNKVDDNRCLTLLSLSYSHLPACLKPCFLYLGMFPEDNVISVSKLVRLWVAEGFIKPNEDQSLEEIAESYIKDLVDRNLISVHSFLWNGKVKTFSIHDLVRDLCIRLAEKDKFLCVTSDLNAPQEMNRQRRIVINGSTDEHEYYKNRVLGTLKSESLARTLILNQVGRHVHLKSRLLRVLVQVYCETRDICFQQVNLRFLAQEYGFWSFERNNFYQLPSSISLLWNVQTLIITEGVGHKVYAPPEIWEMPQLRHVICYSIYLPEPPLGDGIVLHNLQTLRSLVNFRFSEEARKRMPNIKKLRVYCFGYFFDSANFASFNKLESLHCEFAYAYTPRQDDFLQSFKFPNSLKKLTLEWMPLKWEDLRLIGSLPNLEALILDNSVSGPNWDPVEGEFLRLRYLRIESCDLVFWNADDTHFPVLENLVLDLFFSLNEIPLGIGDIQTLERISLVNCSVSAAVSAIRILEEQESFGNQGLKLKVDFPGYDSYLEEFMQQVELEGLKGVNFQIGGA